MSLLDLMAGLTSPRAWADHHIRGLREARDTDSDPMVKVEVLSKPVIAAGRGVPARTKLPKQPPPPEYVGQWSGARVGLGHMQAIWDAHGVLAGPTITPMEFCLLPKCPGKVYAVPSRELWPWTAHLIREVWTPLRNLYGPLSVRGYRPPAYNEAVGGSRRSDHMWAVALDIRAPDPDTLKLLKVSAACLYIAQGRRLKMSFGVYRNNIHVGVGIRRRHWGDAATWIKKARQT